MLTTDSLNNFFFLIISYMFSVWYLGSIELYK